MAEERKRRDSGRSRATKRVGEVSRARRKNDNKAMMTMICGVVLLFGVVFGVQIMNGRNTLNKLRADEQRLEAEYGKQQDISEELKEKEVYVKTNAYIEEQARKIGLVYPDEIIFKPED
ncbi:MAG: septum formation initiator family protein [Lachnospiraceae bacterium]|nr:septum formation initiator family protein [Lachnospiraceae bacterium]